MIIGYILINRDVSPKIATNNKNVITETLRIVPINENIKDSQIVERLVFQASYLRDMSNNELNADEAEVIIIRNSNIYRWIN